MTSTAVKTAKARVKKFIGTAAQQVCRSRANLQQFQGDCEQINTELTQQVQTVLGEIDAQSTLLADLYTILGKHEMALFDDGLGGSRTVARAANWRISPSRLAGQSPTIPRLGRFPATRRPPAYWRAPTASLGFIPIRRACDLSKGLRWSESEASSRPRQFTFGAYRLLQDTAVGLCGVLGAGGPSLNAPPEGVWPRRKAGGRGKACLSEGHGLFR
jgi:hypothetical protein